MSPAAAIHAAFSLSIGLIVFSLGLRCVPRDATFLLRERGLLFRSILAMNVVQPLVAILLVSITNVHPAVKVALVALAVSPVPPVLPNKQLKLVVRTSYVYGELFATAVLSIIFIPATMALLAHVSGRATYVPTATVARIICVSILVPLALGMLVRRLWPAFALKAGPLISTAGTAVLAVAASIALVAAWPAVNLLIGNGTVLVCLLFAAIGVFVGHVIGGPSADDRTVLALSNAARHPAMAIAIGAAAFPEQKLVPAAVVLYLFASAIATAPYTAWRKRLHAARAPTAHA
jgi:BASS family bile acid:Na+ symporter